MLSNWCGLRCSICIADLVNDVIALKDLVMMISVFLVYSPSGAWELIGHL
jgi:hypothetical protein